MKLRSRRRGQTMVEYIIIVVLIAIALLALFTKFGKGIGKKVSGATSALDADVGSEAQSEYQKLEQGVQRLQEDGTFR